MIGQFYDRMIVAPTESGYNKSSKFTSWKVLETAPELTNFSVPYLEKKKLPLWYEYCVLNIIMSNVYLHLKLLNVKKGSKFFRILWHLQAYFLLKQR